MIQKVYRFVVYILLPFRFEESLFSILSWVLRLGRLFSFSPPSVCIMSEPGLILTFCKYFWISLLTVWRMRRMWSHFLIRRQCKCAGVPSVPAGPLHSTPARPDMLPIMVLTGAGAGRGGEIYLCSVQSVLVSGGVLSVAPLLPRWDNGNYRTHNHTLTQ